MTTYYLLKNRPGYLLWLAHTVQHWVIIQIKLPALWVITASSSCTLATPCDQNCFNVGPMYPTLAQQQPSIGPTSLTVSVPRQLGAGHYRGDNPLPPPRHMRCFKIVTTSLTLARQQLWQIVTTSLTLARQQLWLNVMSYLHDHDHVDMVTAMRHYAGSAPSGDRFSPANPANRRCPGIVLLLDQQRRRWTDINPLSPHDALKHHFTSLKTDLLFLQLRVLEEKFP